MSNDRKIAFLACRIISVYLLANWHGSFSGSVINLFQYEYPLNVPSLLNGVMSMAIPILIGVLLWINADKLAGYMVKTHADEKKKEMLPADVDMDNIQVLAFTTIGVFLIVNAIPSLCSALTMYAVIPEPHLGQIAAENISRLVASVIRIIFGLCLILSGRGLVKLIQKVRTVGVK